MSGLKLYECFKRVHAQPMSRGDYNTSKRWLMPEGENGADEGYQVTYNLGTEDEYVSWSPKHIFDTGYTEVGE
jgi:hypothetical protein